MARNALVLVGLIGVLGAVLFVRFGGAPGGLSGADGSDARGAAPAPEALQHAWPPEVGQPYPDLELLDHRGQPVRLSDLRGKVIVVEPIGISCPACQAYVGAHEVGGFRGVRPQPELPTFDVLLEDFGGVEAEHPDLVYVQLLLYDMSAARAPSLEDAQDWVAHFGLAARPNAVVLLGDARYVNPASYAMIPGFQVIDREFVLRADGTGHHPKHHPYREVLRLAGELLREGG